MLHLKGKMRLTDDQLCRVNTELFQDQMVIVTNMKPVLGELDFKFDSKQRDIHFVRISLRPNFTEGASTLVRLRSNADIQVALCYTHLL